jgi:hypothetical protein
MRRLARISEVLGSEEALVVAVRLLTGPAKQKDLVAELRDAGIPRAQPRLSELMKPYRTSASSPARRGRRRTN